MKNAGIIILIVGVLMTLYTGFTYVTRDKVMDMKDFEISMDRRHTVDWEPYVGVAVMVVGGALLVLARKKPTSA